MSTELAHCHIGHTGFSYRAELAVSKHLSAWMNILFHSNFECLKRTPGFGIVKLNNVSQPGALVHFMIHLKGTCKQYSPVGWLFKIEMRHTFPVMFPPVLITPSSQTLPCFTWLPEPDQSGWLVAMEKWGSWTHTRPWGFETHSSPAGCHMAGLSCHT